jgi:hypothetical protein
VSVEVDSSWYHPRQGMSWEHARTHTQTHSHTPIYFDKNCMTMDGIVLIGRCIIVWYISFMVLETHAAGVGDIFEGVGGK